VSSTPHQFFAYSLGFGMPALILAASALTFVTVAAVTDFATHRIPNRLTVPAAIAALSINSILAGFTGAISSLVGLALGLAVLLPLFLTRQFGAGDVKAVAVVGAFLGPQGILPAVAFTLLAGVLGGLLVLITQGGWGALRSMLGRWMFRAYVLCTTGGAANISAPAGDASRIRFPYGLAIALGTGMGLLWEYHGG
jgi:prepilin peptidase CpaA